MTAKIVTVFNQKGGCGKTTITMSLAGSMAKRGHRVLVVDMDPQGTASRWASGKLNEFPATVISLSPMEGQMHREVQKFVEDYSLIFIDCPPSMNSVAPSSAMLISDLALIPIVPSPADIWAAAGAIKLSEQAQAINNTLTVRLVANMVQRSTSLAKDLLDQLEEENPVPLLKATLGLRTSFRDSQIYGSTVHVVPRATAAVAEVEAMADEVLGLLKVPLIVETPKKTKGAKK